MEADPNGGTITVFVSPEEVKAFIAELLEAGADQFKGVPVFDECVRNDQFQLTTVTLVHRNISAHDSVRVASLIGMAI